VGEGITATAQALSIEELSLRFWRNIPELVLEPHPAFNVFHGENAQGKTNLLEAIYVIARLKTFREARLAQLVTHGEAAGRVAAKVRRAGVTQSVEVSVIDGHRRVRVDGKGIGRISDHGRHYKVVLFTPEDIYLARGAPGARRQFLDRALFNLEPAFLADAQDWKKLLRNRNALLKQGAANGTGPGFWESVEAYDEVLTAVGARIATRRQALVHSLSERMGGVWERVFGGQADISLRYESTVPGVMEGASLEEVTTAYAERLTETRSADLRRGATGTGPHLDDIVAMLEGRPIREHGSQGQNRVMVLALKVTEIQLVIEQTGIRPILLLDDVSSELDRKRNGQLFDYLDEIRGQVFLTTTAPDLVGLSVDRAEFEVEAGNVCRSS
jgi:DNA replication and repair protein RecF